jgi:glycerol-3-phosphate acyltransferase PlsX
LCSSKISIHPAEEVIEMKEAAAASVRRKRNSSIVVGVELLKNKTADAFFSAGNTGAVVCAAVLSLEPLVGIERPGIAVILPTLEGMSLLIDVGANIDSKPTHLLQYGIMADTYCRYILNKSNPSVGLLNVGEEATKGTEFVKETYKLLEASPLNFIGNVEGKDVFLGKSDIIICDGFLGNAVLKVTEGLAELVVTTLKQELSQGFFTKFVSSLIKPRLRQFKKRLDYSEYGGAPLLGLNGVVIIGHGRSSTNAIKNAIRVAKEEVEHNFNEEIVKVISKMK